MQDTKIIKMPEYKSAKEGNIEVPEIILDFIERKESDNPDIIHAVQSVRHSSLGVISVNGKPNPKLLKHLFHAEKLRPREEKALTKKLHRICLDVRSMVEKRIHEIKNPNKRREIRNGCEPLLNQLSSRSNDLSLSDTLNLIADKFEFVFMKRDDFQHAINTGYSLRSQT